MVNKRILQINGGLFGSTGKIMFSLEKTAIKNGYEVLCCSPITENKASKKRFYKIESLMVRKINAFFDYVFGVSGFFALVPTLKLIKTIKKFNPGIIHLHTIHGSFINLRILFNFFKKNNYNIVWTFHDCWPFTGRCPYFSMVNCEKWKNGCEKCPYPKNMYPRSFVDRTKKMWNVKKKCFTGIKNLTVVTPSIWLANLVKESFLKDYSICTINNGIDLDVFKPTEKIFRKNNKLLANKHIVLGVAFGWGERKGLDVFIRLSKDLDNDYQIVLVGTDDFVDKMLMNTNILSIHKTNNQEELADIYSSADLFVNPTREDNYPTVNMEAIACGTPVLTFKTGGSYEMIDESCGAFVECDDYKALIKKVISICEEKPFLSSNCVQKAKTFSSAIKFSSYINLYNRLLNK